MEIKISVHAMQRMMERGLTEQQVRHFFATNEGLLCLDISDKDPTVATAEAFIDGRKYRFIYNVREDTLVTVYPIK